jgi:farnesyl diphosphate synthase
MLLFWRTQEGVGNIAINDSFMLEASIYFLLKKHFRSEKYYVDLLELFHEVCYWGVVMERDGRN